MIRAMNKKMTYWIGGSATAFLGVGLVKLLSPEISGVAGAITMGSGYILVVVGITLISCATRRQQSEAFIIVDKPAKNRNRR